MSQFKWTDFYMELADKLLVFRDDRAELLDLIVELYERAGIKMPKLDEEHRLIDMDPFTFFGIFNKGLSDENRSKLIGQIKELFNIKADVPVGYAGIPVLNNLNSTFYRFVSERDEKDIDILWDVFAAALKYADERSEENRIDFIDSYNNAKDLKGNRWKLTMGLYWIRPYTFINLDSTNRKFITETNTLSAESTVMISDLKDIPDGELYLEICESFDTELNKEGCKYSSFPELSLEAWIVSEQRNEEDKKKLSEPSKSESASMVDADVETVRYWLYAPGQSASNWDDYYDKGKMAIGWSEIGNLRAYSNQEEMRKAMQKEIEPNDSFIQSAHMTWCFTNVMKPGDIVFVKKGMYKIIGRGVVTSDYRYEPEAEDGFAHVRDVRWEEKGEWNHPGIAAMKTLTDITSYTEYIDQLKALFVDEEVSEERAIEYPEYNKSDFLKDVFMEEGKYDTLVGALRRKKNIILQGAPGVGKTYAAKRLAYSMIGEKNIDRVKMVQFHQSYSYEDFIMGFRPVQEGFELHTGIFYDFCKTAEVDTDNDYFFIIDEINRGNISKIFGEVFMLVEGDKRDYPIDLVYKDELFSIPKNLYIIGMMNTADRSLAMLDYALRRRFAFFDFAPAFEVDSFKEYCREKNNHKYDLLIETVMQLNEEITDDESLGEGFRIGHSYFITKEEITDEFLQGTVEFELIPLLKEYWFDEPQKVRTWSEVLRGSIK